MEIEKQEASQEEAASGGPLDFVLPPVTDVDDSYIDNDEAENELDLAAGIKVNKKPDESVPENSEPEERTENEGERYRGRLSTKGQAFDPELHKAPPEETPTGRWKKLPRKKIEENATKTKEEAGPDVRAEAQKLATIYASLHMIPFGEGGTVDNNTLPMLIESYERYMVENGVVETPAGLNAIISSFVYSVGISQRRGNIEKIKGYFARAYGWFKGRKQKRVKKNEPKQPEEKSEQEAPQENEAQIAPNLKDAPIPANILSEEY